MSFEDYEDDLSIVDEELLWRRVHPLQVTYDNNLKRKRPSSKAFQNSSNGTGMSVNISSETTVADTLIGCEDHLLVVFPTSLARSLGQGVMRQPLPEQPAHAEVFGKKKGSTKNGFAKNCAWVVAPPS